MTNRPLIINDEVRAKIAEAIKRAEANPLPLAYIKSAAVPAYTVDLKLSERKPGFERPESENVLIPVGFRVAFSIEEQPVGMCGHLSISVDNPRKVPHPEAVKMIANEYGLKVKTLADPNITVWFEEFEPGHRAINLVALWKPGAIQ